MPAPDEQALRRPGFLGGVPIVLCDGREWTFPEPTVEFAYDPGPRGFRLCLSFGPEYQDKLDAATEATDGADVIRTELALAFDLLTRNYDLTPADFAQLVRLNPRDPGRQEMRQRIMEVAGGQGPKPSTAGDGSPSSPTA